VDEAAIGAVLEQAADQIGQQLLMPADRRIGAQRHARVAAADEGSVEDLAHAVQTLMLDRHVGLLGHAAHRGERMGIVRRQLRIEMRARLHQRLRADQKDRSVAALVVNTG
jgi:hypothetical protein